MNLFILQTKKLGPKKGKYITNQVLSKILVASQRVQEKMVRQHPFPEPLLWKRLVCVILDPYKTQTGPRTQYTQKSLLLLLSKELGLKLTRAGLYGFKQWILTVGQVTALVLFNSQWTQEGPQPSYSREPRPRLENQVNSGREGYPIKISFTSAFYGSHI